MRLSVIGILALCCLSASPAAAHGPFITIGGEPVIWKSLPVSYSVDLGPLGIYNNEDATQLADDSFAVWFDVSTADFTAVKDGQLPVDVTAANYALYLGRFNDGINPVVFDSNGQIIEALYGGGSSSYILGYTQTAYIPILRAFAEAEIVINGLPTTGYTLLEIMSTVVHELGHLTGLDHTQINRNLVSPSGNPADTVYVPTMYPFATQNDEPLAELNPDDTAGLTLLYSNPTADAQYGTLRGTVTRTTDAPVLGANVLAKMVGNELMNVFSSVSDYEQQGTGQWEMRVFPGTYRLSIEPIDSRFTGGSSVGPYADYAADLSFQNPVAPQECSQTFTVAAGQTLDDISIVAGGECSSSGNLVETNPCIAISFDSSQYTEGQTAVATINMTEGTVNNVVDVYWLVMDPQGVVYNLANFLPESENFTPLLQDYTVSTLEVQWSILLSGITPGIYTWGAAMTMPGADLTNPSSWLCEPSVATFELQ